MKWLLRKLFFREALLPLILLLFLLHASVLQPLQREIPWRTSLLVRVLVLILCFISFFPPITDILHLFYVTSLPFSFGETARRSEQGWSGEDESCRRRRWGVPQEEPLTYTGPLPVPASEDMGCGLRKLEDPEDSSPGKIYSTLKRPQVETKSDIVYEYVLLDFSLEGRNHGNEGGSLGNIQHWF